MEAKDTVMHLDEIDDGRMPNSYASQRKALEKQAEISFPMGKREGIKEVVGDIVALMDCRLNADTFAQKICGYCEAKLKDLT